MCLWESKKLKMISCRDLKEIFFCCCSFEDLFSHKKRNDGICCSMHDKFWNINLCYIFLRFKTIWKKKELLNRKTKAKTRKIIARGIACKKYQRINILSQRKLCRNSSPDAIAPNNGILFGESISFLSKLIHIFCCSLYISSKRKSC